MKVESEFEINQFISYLNKFDNLLVVNKTYSNNHWDIGLNDGAKYLIENGVWEMIQSKVPRLNKNKILLH